jgi:uncharacterized protein (TIGR02646 family)
MRPVEKWNVGDPDGASGQISHSYIPHGSAASVLIRNLGYFCSYCEVFDSSPQIEHVVPVIQDRSKQHEWANFLLACSRCNGADNKGSKPVVVEELYLPHLNNTLLPFVYLEGGKVQVREGLGPEQRRRAEKTMKLIGLDKYPGNADYPSHNPRDKRWEHRRKAWEVATRKLSAYLSGNLSAQAIAEFAHQKGFFSVWYTVFKAHQAVVRELIDVFEGTKAHFFDENDGYSPIPRGD